MKSTLIIGDDDDAQGATVDDNGCIGEQYTVGILRGAEVANAWTLLILIVGAEEVLRLDASAEPHRQTEQTERAPADKPSDSMFHDHGLLTERVVAA